MTTTLYSRAILRLAVSNPHEGRLPEPGGSAEKYSTTCGSRVVADVMLSADGRLSELGMDVSACALGQASATLLARAAIGKAIGDFEQGRDALRAFFDGSAPGPGDWPDIGALADARDHPGRHGAILLPYEAVIAAMLQVAEQTGRPVDGS